MALVSTGITITVDSADPMSGFFAEITDITLPSYSREALDTSHQTTSTYKTFTPSILIDAGELKIDMFFDPDMDVPIDEDPSTITIRFADADTSGWEFEGFLTNYEPTGSLDKLMTASCTVKVTGDISMLS